MEHKRGLGEVIACREAQGVNQECQESFLRMRSLKPLVDQAIAAHSRNELSEGRLRRILLAFADTQTEYTNAFRRVISFMADDDSDGDDFFTQPVLAIPEYFQCGPPPPYEEVEQDMGINMRQNPGLRRRGNNSASDNSSRPTPQNSSGGGAGHPTGGDDAGDDPGNQPPDYEAEDHFQQGGCCGECLRALLSALGRAFSAFVDLVATCLRALWDFICFIGGKILELAQMVRQMIDEGSQRMNHLVRGEALVPLMI